MYVVESTQATRAGFTDSGGMGHVWHIQAQIKI